MERLTLKSDNPRDENPARWMRIAMSVFGSSKWESRLVRVSAIHADALDYILNGVKDLGLELSGEQELKLKILNKGKK